MRMTLLQLVRRGTAAADADSDADLLRRFAEFRDESAFAALVDRHGAMVWAVCRHAVPNRTDAEDVFQATFFALAQSAKSVRRPERLGAWLHGAAVRIAGAAKRAHARRVRRERTAARPETDDSLSTTTWNELHAAAHAAVAELPPALRAAFVLCDLEGTEPATAAARLGVKLNTLSGQLCRARKMLLDRFSRRGISPAAIALGAAVAAPPVAARGPVSAAVIQLAKEATVMSFVKFKILAVGLAVLVGAGVLPKADGQNAIRITTVATPGAPKHTIDGWGTVTDPDGDCKFSFTGTKQLAIGIPGKDHALSVERGQMNAPRILRDADGDFIAQVKVTAEFPQGARSLVRERRAFHGAGLLLWVSEKTFIRLERAELVAGEKNMGYASFELRKDGEFVRAGSADEMPLTEKETHLRLERRGGKVFASVSADGVKWTSFEPIAVDLPKKVQVGVCAGHNTSSGFTPMFEEYKLFVEK